LQHCNPTTRNTNKKHKYKYKAKITQIYPRGWVAATLVFVHRTANQELAANYKAAVAAPQPNRTQPN